MKHWFWTDKYPLLIYAFVALTYTVYNNKLCLRFIESWIMVTGYISLLAFCYIQLRNKTRRKKNEKNKHNIVDTVLD